MTYQPLHLKYRPKTLAELVGQHHIATTLANALTAGRIVPAYLFTGPRGTGKTSTARILAKSLNCQAADAPTPEPCSNCSSCTAIAKGSSLDVIELDAASHSGADNMREIAERVRFAPIGRYKVIVIDECHALSSAAWQVLLLTLESPSERAVFIFCTTEPHKVPATIHSRCQHHPFRSVGTTVLIESLSAVARAEEIDISPEALHLVARLARGGVRDAQTLLDQLSLLPPPITPQQVCDWVGAFPDMERVEFLGAIAAGEPRPLLDRLRALLDRGKAPMTVLRGLVEFYTHLLLAKTSSKKPTAEALDAQTWQSLVELATRMNRETILVQQQHLRSCEGQIKFSAQPELWLEVAVLGLLGASVFPIIPNLENGVTDRPQSSAVNLKETGIASIASSTQPHSVWQVVLALQPPAARALLSQHAQLVAFDGSNATVKIPSAPLRQ
ncbi:DNA polymerase III subunit gamma/tau [Lusitaniella coriacea]|uniref:DNA polymerase III subunit gamma/tau n=1 Tax=Lusitaniella coriacea TaxID=1983105 RepID=UPI003CF2C286